MKTVKTKDGTLHGEPVIHETSGLNVIINKNNKRFVSGWKLSDKQLENVIEKGSL